MNKRDYFRGGNRRSYCTGQAIPTEGKEKKIVSFVHTSMYGDCVQPGCIGKPGCVGKSNANNLPAPTDLTENPYGEKTFF